MIAAGSVSAAASGLLSSDWCTKVSLIDQLQKITSIDAVSILHDSMFLHKNSLNGNARKSPFLTQPCSSLLAGKYRGKVVTGEWLRASISSVSGPRGVWCLGTVPI